MLVTAIVLIPDQTQTLGRGLLQTITFNPFPNKPWFLRVCMTSLLKTLWEKAKLLVTSNFSFFHCVFYPFGELSASFIEFEIVVCNLCQFGRVLNFLFGKGLKLSLYHTMTTCYVRRKKVLKTLLEKEKMLCNSIFSFSHYVFYFIKEKSHHLSHNETFVIPPL